jgi:hypothetical protein
MSTSVPPTLAEARFRTLVDRLGAIVWEAVPGPKPGEATFTFVSDGTETLLGYPAASWPPQCAQGPGRTSSTAA